MIIFSKRFLRGSVFIMNKGGQPIAGRSRKQICDPCHQRHQAQRPCAEKCHRKAVGRMAKEP